MAEQSRDEFRSSEANCETSHCKRENEKRNGYSKSVLILYFIIFLQSVQFSIYFSSLWPYLKNIDPDVQDVFLGWTVAAYSLGQLVASPLLGYLSNCTSKYRWVLQLSICGSIAANLFFVFAGHLPHQQRYAIFGARLLMGIAASVHGTAMGYIVKVSDDDKRDKAISVATACMSFGCIAGPALQAAVSFLGYPGLSYSIFYLNLYTAPAYLCILLFVVSFIFTSVTFEEPSVFITGPTAKTQVNVIPLYNRLSVVALIWCCFSVYAVLVNLDTICTPLCIAYYSWSAEDATLYVSLLTGVGSIFSVAVYVLHTFLLHKFNERKLIVIGSLLLIFSLVFSYPYPFWSVPIDKNSGCHFTWCRDVRQVPVEIFIFSVLFLFIGFPPVIVAVSTLYAKVIGPREQAGLQSILVAAGSLSRLVCPVAVVTLLDSFGPCSVWLFTGSLALSIIVATACCYKILVPLCCNAKAEDTYANENGFVIKY